MSRDVDYYALLGVTKDANESEIRDRFRSLAREAHPDRASRDHKAEAEAKFQELTEAVNVLTNPARRKSYDFEQAFKASGAASADADSVTQSLLARGMHAYKEKEFDQKTLSSSSSNLATLFFHAQHSDPKQYTESPTYG